MLPPTVETVGFRTTICMNFEYLFGSVHCNDEEALIELCNKYHYNLFKMDNNYYDIESYGTRYEHIKELKNITYDYYLRYYSGY